MNNYKITLFTPAYNRAHTLPRLFDCIKNLTYSNFEWIIVDDGSQDNTKDVVKGFISERPDLDIIYKYQTNHGKHIATNVASAIATGDFFITIDSDDAFKPEALSIFLSEWDKIDNADKHKYKGISCRTCDVDGNLNGGRLPAEYLDCTELDLRFKYKIEGELWGMTRIDVIREFPYPEIEGLHFYPENIHWNEVGRKYITRFIDEPLRYYINDTDNALTGSNNSAVKETFYMRKHFINECWDYFKYDRKFFIKNLIGLSRDGLRTGKGFSEIISTPDTFFKKLLSFLLFPVGWFLSKR